MARITITLNDAEIKEAVTAYVTRTCGLESRDRTPKIKVTLNVHVDHGDGPGGGMTTYSVDASAEVER